MKKMLASLEGMHGFVVDEEIKAAWNFT